MTALMTVWLLYAFTLTFAVKAEDTDEVKAKLASVSRKQLKGGQLVEFRMENWSMNFRLGGPDEAFPCEQMKPGEEYVLNVAKGRVGSIDYPFPGRATPDGTRYVYAVRSADKSLQSLEQYNEWSRSHRKMLLGLLAFSGFGVIFLPVMVIRGKTP